jgi:hypothetical protein
VQEVNARGPRLRLSLVFGLAFGFNLSDRFGFVGFGFDFFDLEDFLGGFLGDVRRFGGNFRRGFGDARGFLGLDVGRLVRGQVFSVRDFQLSESRLRPF